MSLAAAWEDHADEWIQWTRTSAHDGFWTARRGSWSRSAAAGSWALFANGLAITELTEGGAGIVPWLLALRAEKRPR